MSLNRNQQLRLEKDKERVNNVLRVTHEIVARHKHDHTEIKFDGEAPPDGGKFKRVVDAWKRGVSSPRWFSLADITKVQVALDENDFKPAEGTADGRWNKYWDDVMASALDLAQRNYTTSHG